MTVGSPHSIRRRQLGRELRDLRVGAKVTAEQLAQRLGCSASRISRIETATIKIGPETVYGIVAALGLVAVDVDRLAELAREAERPQWWQRYSAQVSTVVASYYSLESDACLLEAFEPHLVHGLLQTDGYIGAVARHWGVDATYLERLVQSRHERRESIRRSAPFDLDVVMDEAVLHRAIGGPAVMRDQLETLIEYASMPNIHIRVVAFEAGMTSSPGGPFVILHFGEPEPPVVYVESVHDQTLLNRKPLVDGYVSTFRQLQAEALSEHHSRRLIEHVRLKFTDSVI